jgi:hypothetical protein
MAINVNTVYKTVLSILNKEQRGYLTPDEFNKVARQVQQQLLDLAFYEYNKMLNLDTFGRTNAGYADLPKKTKEKIEAFYKTETKTTGSDNKLVLPSDIYKLIDLNIVNKTISLEEIDKSELSYMLSSPLTKPTSDFPIYYKTTTSNGETTIVVEPNTSDDISIDYIKLPKDPRFGYSRNSTYGTNVYDENPYIADGLVLGGANIGIVSTNTTDGTNAAGAGYSGTIGETSGFTTNGSGVGGNITIIIDGNTVTSVKINTAGSGYKVGDTITISKDTGSPAIGGSTDVVLTLRNEDVYSTSTKGSTNFELHPSDEPSLILSVLAMTGVIMKDQVITKLGADYLVAQQRIKQQ